MCRPYLKSVFRPGQFGRVLSYFPQSRTNTLNLFPFVRVRVRGHSLDIRNHTVYVTLFLKGSLALVYPTTTGFLQDRGVSSSPRDDVNRKLNYIDNYDNNNHDYKVCHILHC